MISNLSFALVVLKARVQLEASKRGYSLKPDARSRQVALLPLQCMFSPRLAAKNDGIVTVRRWEVLQFLQAAKKTGQLLEPKAFASFMVPYK